MISHNAKALQTATITPDDGNGGGAAAQPAWSVIPIEGGRLVQDTANHTQWVSDANLFKTLANAGGDPAAFVN